MARFAYNGESSALVSIQGVCKTIKIPLQNGSFQIINAEDQSVGFQIGSDIGVDINDIRSIRVMLSDPRFTRLS